MRGPSRPPVQAARDTLSAAGALGQIFFQRAVMQWLAAGAFEPGHIPGVLHALQQFLIIPYGDDHRDGLAFARYDFRFWHGRFHIPNIQGLKELRKRQATEKEGQ